MDNITLGLTAKNMNYRNKAEDMRERVMFTIELREPIDDKWEVRYIFKVPGLWTNIIQDYYHLVRMAYPKAAKITWEILED